MFAPSKTLPQRSSWKGQDTPPFMRSWSVAKVGACWERCTYCCHEGIRNESSTVRRDGHCCCLCRALSGAVCTQRRCWFCKRKADRSVASGEHRSAGTGWEAHGHPSTERHAENLDQFTSEQLEARNRHAIARFLQRDGVELLGIETVTEEPVVWCGLHDIDWKGRQCDTGFWVRRSAQGRNIATESTNAMVRYAFGALGMRRVGLTHSAGNEASRRIAEKLGFVHEGVQRAANPLPGGRIADRFCYARFAPEGLPPLDVHWGKE